MDQLLLALPLARTAAGAALEMGAFLAEPSGTDHQQEVDFEPSQPLATPA
jgi:hypothetical protein